MFCCAVVSILKTESGFFIGIFSKLCPNSLDAERESASVAQLEQQTCFKYLIYGLLLEFIGWIDCTFHEAEHIHYVYIHAIYVNGAK